MRLEHLERHRLYAPTEAAEVGLVIGGVHPGVPAPVRLSGGLGEVVVEVERAVRRSNRETVDWPTLQRGVNPFFRGHRTVPHPL